MRYSARTTFELLRYQATVNGNGIALPYVVQVAANGASRVQFFVMPLTYIPNTNPRNPAAGVGESQILHAVPRVNGIPLIPIVLDVQVAGPNGPLSVSNRLQASDRLDFNNGPEVTDHTVYRLEFPVFLLEGDVLFLGAEVMVARTFITPHH